MWFFFLLYFGKKVKVAARKGRMSFCGRTLLIEKGEGGAKVPLKILC